MANEFFVIGSEDPSFRTAGTLFRLPNFRGIVVLEGSATTGKFGDAVFRQTVEGLKKISLGNFLNYIRKNPNTELVSFYDFSAGWRFLDSLKANKRFTCKVYSYYNYYLEHNLPCVFTPAQSEREQILNAHKEWAELRTQLTDEFSKFSLDCYIKTAETKNTRVMLPAYIDRDLKIVNRVTRKASIIPHQDEIYVDVGAWDGDTVTTFVDVATIYKKVYAFEPSSFPFQRLEKRKFYLSDFEPRQEAVSNFTGELKFFATPTPGSRGSDIVVDKAEETVNVPCVKLDDVMDDATILKIEVEGYETRVIEGAANLIKKCKPEMAVYSYHFPLDPFHIVQTVNKAHHYKHIALRFHGADPHMSIVYFSDRAAFE